MLVPVKVLGVWTRRTLKISMFPVLPLGFSAQNGHPNDGEERHVTMRSTGCTPQPASEGVRETQKRGSAAGRQ